MFIRKVKTYSLIYSKCIYLERTSFKENPFVKIIFNVKKCFFFGSFISFNIDLSN